MPDRPDGPGLAQTSGSKAGEPLSSRRPADALRMFETHTSEKGETQSQFGFEAMCERRCAVFGELPPSGPPDDPTAR